MSPRKSSKLEPVFQEMQPQKMAVVKGQGTPDKVFTEVMPALYGSVYTLKFDLKKQGLETFKIGAPRARYPDASAKPKDKWTILVGLPIPEETTLLPQKIPFPKVEIETWQYGTVAQILHEGSYSEEEPTITKLQQFIQGNGYEIIGVHEEEYLSRPESKIPKTIIRYQVKKV